MNFSSLSTWEQFLPLIVLFALMWWFMIRPQRKRQQERQELLDSLNKGDKIVTIGGIHGQITLLKEDTARVKIADGVEVTFDKRGISYREGDEE